MRKTNSPRATDQLLADLVDSQKQSGAFRQPTRTMMQFILSQPNLGNDYTRVQVARHLASHPQ